MTLRQVQLVVVGVCHVPLAQFDFLVQVRDDLTRTHRAIRRLRAARTQIEAVKGRFGEEHAALTHADRLEDMGFRNVTVPVKRQRCVLRD